MKVPAVTIDITDDGTAYTVTALPWPSIESAGQPYVARLVHTRHHYPIPDISADPWHQPTSWTPERVAAFVRKLMATYPKVSA